MPIQKINPAADSHIACGSYTLGGSPADMSVCEVGEPELNNDVSQDLVGVTGAVISVNGYDGEVILDPDDLNDSVTVHKFVTQAQKNKIDSVETGADVTDATNVAAAGAHMSGGTDVPVTDGGTGASTAAGARTNLGLAIGTNVQAHSSVLDNTTASFTSTLATKLNNLHANVKGSVINVTTDQIYEPIADDGEEYMNAFLEAYGEAVDGDRLELYPGAEYISNDKYTVAKNLVINGNNAIIKRKDATQTDWVIEFSGTAVTGDYNDEGGGVLRVYDLEVNGNYENVTLTSARGEGIRVSGTGSVELYNCYAHSGPVGSGTADDAAVNFFVIGSGHKKLVGCKGDRPSYANYRIQATTSEYLGCDSFCTEFTGNYGRLWVMDGSSVLSCIINGGTWKVTASMKINANFDPDTSTTIDAYQCEKLVLSNIMMDFGTGHNSAGGDSFIKFDNCRRVYVSNIIQNHSQIYRRASSNPTTTAGTGFKWWDTGSGVIESLFTVGTVTECHFRDISADGYVKLAGSSGGPYAELVTMTNCSWGTNAHIYYGIENCNHAKRLIINNCAFHNIIGVGSDRKVFNNAQSSNRQQIRIANSYVSTFWSGNHGFLFGTCGRVGEIATEGLELLDKNTSDYVTRQTSLGYYLEGFAASNYLTYTLNNNYLRLMITPKLSDPQTAILHRDILRRYDYANSVWKEGSLVSLGSGTFSENQISPADPGVDDGDWFPNVTADPGSKIVNLKSGAGGNGFANFWVCDDDGNFIEDPAIRTY